MINGKYGRTITICMGIALVLLVIFRAVMFSVHQPEAANSMDTVITLLTGAILGTLGVNPYTSVHPPVLYDPSLEK